ncbi:hypothetical protein Rs2_04056 [Raphanus sativus]|nr:hypothetical protein Rs2_04056 [Raphanus sativus]
MGANRGGMQAQRSASAQSHGRYDVRERREHEGAYHKSSPSNGAKREGDLRQRISERRDSKNVWARLDNSKDSKYPRDRERYHPYHRSIERNVPDHRNFKNRGTEGPRFEINSGSSHWNAADTRRAAAQRDYQSISRRSSSHRRGSPDSQRTITAPYETHRGGGGNREQYRRSPGENLINTSGRGKLVIRDPIPREQQEEHNTQENPIDKQVRNEGQELNKIMRDNGTDMEDLEIEENPVVDDEELVDDGTFEKMVEQFTEPEFNPLEDEEMLNIDEVDDLMEEEQEIEKARLEKEKLDAQAKLIKTNASLPPKQTGKEDSTLGEKETVRPPSSKMRLPTGAREDRQARLIPLEKKKRAPASPDMKGGAASRKLAALGRSSPRSKTMKQTRATQSRTPSHVPPNEVYPSALKGRKPSATGSVVSQKPPSKRI